MGCGQGKDAVPDATSVADMLGATLLTAEGEKPTSEVLAGATAIGIYFSAHWCPPCRNFTPKLAEQYTNAYKDKGMKIIFASSDKDDASFQEYFGQMPWAAVPFANRAVVDELSKRFEVQGIPMLVLLTPAGKLYSADGRQVVTDDPAGEKYPWMPNQAGGSPEGAAILKALGPELVEKAAGKPIGLYFSAHWCPPCRAFTPQLAGWYTDGLKEKMEIIFVSSDQDKAQFDEYAGSMPWPALPFEKKGEKDELSKACGVKGIPSFSVLNPDGTVITHQGRAAVTSDPKGANFPAGWAS